MQRSFTLIIAGPSSCGKTTFVIRLLECSFVALCIETWCGVIVKRTPSITLKTFHF